MYEILKVSPRDTPPEQRATTNTPGGALLGPKSRRRHRGAGRLRGRWRRSAAAKAEGDEATAPLGSLPLPPASPGSPGRRVPAPSITVTGTGPGGPPGAAFVLAEPGVTGAGPAVAQPWGLSFALPPAPAPR